MPELEEHHAARAVTILNIYLTERNALVGVDTHGVVPGRPQRIRYNKLHALHHMNAVIVGRGLSGLLERVYLSACWLQSVDEAAAQMPELVPAVWRGFLKTRDWAFVAANWPDDWKYRQEIYLVGWSKRRAAMCAWSYAQDDPEQGFKAEVTPEHGLVRSPIDAQIEALGEPSSPDLMLDVARAQARYVREKEPDKAGGGELVIAELTRTGIRTYIAGTLEEPKPSADSGGPWGGLPRLHHESLA